VATIYIRPRHPIPLQFFQDISNTYRTYVIMADINIHSRSDRQRNLLMNYIYTQTTGVMQQLPKHTRPISQTIADIVILSPNPLNRCHIDLLDTIGSDHVPLKLKIQRRLQTAPGTIPQRTTIYYDRANWDMYRDYIIRQLQNAEEPTNEDILCETIETITTPIQTASDKHVPKTRAAAHRPKLQHQYLATIRRSRQHFKDYIRSSYTDNWKELCTTT